MASSFIRSYFKYTVFVAILRKAIPLLGTLIFIGYTAYAVWLGLGPKKLVPDYNRQKSANEVVKKIIREIRENRSHIRNVELIHFSNDPTDYFSDCLRRELNSSGILNVEDISAFQKVKRFLNLRIWGVESHEAAFAYVGRSSVEGILWGKVEAFESLPEGVFLKGEWHILDRKSKQIIYSGTFNKDTISGVKKEMQRSLQVVKKANTDTVFQFAASSIPWYGRFLLFVLFMLLLPIVTIAFLRGMVAKQSNGINAFVLGVYTLCDAIFALFMIGGGFNSGLGVLIFLGALLVSFCYNVRLMGFALKLEENNKWQIW